jgi:glycosyltransferase involved in cell wall biosynthesis
MPESPSPIFNGRLGLIQRVLPAYRVPFFDALALRCVGGLSLFAGQPRAAEAIATSSSLATARLSPAQNIHIFSTSSPLYFCYQRGMPDWLDDWNPDALILEANFRYLASPAAMRWMRERGCPVIGWGLGAPAARGPLGWLRRRFLCQFDALIAYSRRGAQQYAACLPGMPEDKIFVAPNAVAEAPTQPLPLRDGHFISRPVLLFVGRLQARKRIPALLKACAALPEQLTPRLIIVGDGPEMENLRTAAHNLFPAAEFVGAKHGKELAEYFTAADLFVLPGTGGLAVQQAMSYGLPVVVAQGDGTQDDLVRPGNGWQIPPDDDPALSTALDEALSDPARLRRMGAESYRIVAEEINLQNMVSVFVQALNSVT